jgi:hypothetical protein
LSHYGLLCKCYYHLVMLHSMTYSQNASEAHMGFTGAPQGMVLALVMIIYLCNYVKYKKEKHPEDKCLLGVVLMSWWCHHPCLMSIPPLPLLPPPSHHLPSLLNNLQAGACSSGDSGITTLLLSCCGRIVVVMVHQQVQNRGTQGRHSQTGEQRTW